MTDKTPNPCLSSTELGFIVIMSLIGLITNSFAANYMRVNFDLSKMIYKILLCSCLIHLIGSIVMLFTALYLWAAGKVIHPPKTQMNLLTLLLLSTLFKNKSQWQFYFPRL